ncbi:hypothetical protein HELRODRAFT_178152 [Helobdella robusta]|uniref:Uncharacterized protein n=1 Tax=Helobdella robusta TaxID=6412 RepID=T1FCU6_HELRO|nr:hypothetical protein HELRODRAFT_178152 [Helobdella robusta]ESN97364.1 hypothetical protein HELRODRAFT_178152 [Helobdella robusta]
MFLLILLKVKLYQTIEGGRKVRMIINPNQHIISSALLIASFNPKDGEIIQWSCAHSKYELRNEILTGPASLTTSTWFAKKTIIIFEFELKSMSVDLQLEVDTTSSKRICVIARSVMPLQILFFLHESVIMVDAMKINTLYNYQVQINGMLLNKFDVVFVKKDNIPERKDSVQVFPNKSVIFRTYEDKLCYYQCTKEMLCSHIYYKHIIQVVPIEIQVHPQPFPIVLSKRDDEKFCIKLFNQLTSQNHSLTLSIKYAFYQASDSKNKTYEKETANPETTEYREVEYEVANKVFCFNVPQLGHKGRLFYILSLWMANSKYTSLYDVTYDNFTKAREGQFITDPELVVKFDEKGTFLDMNNTEKNEMKTVVQTTVADFEDRILQHGRQNEMVNYKIELQNM